ncbi:hypothetical protein PSTG_13616 [Puccinia striiformis f. sp. tritici PST-78]|uniref:Uncharacterized protein n=1 Tax=Puccinia striiformis f. sp. tritici PST-78 TaxID=1165861 RepID=A0A0L0V1Y5_9BASI|nr:hypothetical protein PSTG_13616 [Puccinia striiformis f. sp. tritici PST-78]
MMVESQQNGQVKRHVSQGAGIQTAILAISHAVAGQHHGPRGWTAPRTPWLDSTTDPVAGQHHGPRGWTAPRTPWLDSTTDPVAGQHHGPRGCEPTNLASHGSEPTYLAIHGYS